MKPTLDPPSPATQRRCGPRPARTHALSGAGGASLAMTLAIMLLMASGDSRAIEEPTIADFNGELDPNPLDGAGDSYGVMGGGIILGRSLDIEVAGEVTGDADGGFFVFDGSADAGGNAVLSWDGEDEDPAVTPDGLGGVDLTGEEINFASQDAFLLRFASVSAAGNYAVQVITEEGESSAYSGSVPVSGGQLDITIPYGDFSTSAGDGANFAEVGAIVLTLSAGLSAALDQFQTTSALGGLTKDDDLFVDINGNGLAEPGDTVRYTITLPAAAFGSAVTLDDTPDGNSTLVVGSVSTPVGTVDSGNGAGDTDVTVSLGVLPNAEVVVTFDVLVNDPFGGTDQICNQATVADGGGDPVLSDDPDDSNGIADPTCTPVFVDNVPPELTIPPDLTVDRGDDTSPSATGTATATDDQTSDPLVTFADVETPGPAPFGALIARRWTATDEAGNVSQAVQEITVLDTADRSLVVDDPIYGLFSPASSLAKRQLGAIDTDGNITMLGTDNAIDAGDVTTASGITTYNRAANIVYVVGRTDSDGQPRIFSVSGEDGSASSQILSFGTQSTVVGIWWDEGAEALYGVFQVGTGLADRQLAEIDPDTGLVTLIGVPITGVAGTIGGIASGSVAAGQFYFLGTGGGLPGAIYAVDTATGVATSQALVGANYNAIAGMNFNQSDGTLYALQFVGTERRLAAIATDTGIVTPIGATTIGGGGVPITTYTGVNTLDEGSGTFLFIGRYFNGNDNAWAIFGVDLANGNATFSEIDATPITTPGYYGLDYGEPPGDGTDQRQVPLLPPAALALLACAITLGALAAGRRRSRRGIAMRR